LSAVPDRICLACGTRYTPPDPPWALAALWIAAGSFLALAGVILFDPFDILFGWRSGQILAFRIAALACAILGIAVAISAVRKARQRTATTTTDHPNG